MLRVTQWVILADRSSLSMGDNLETGHVFDWTRASDVDKGDNQANAHVH